MVRFATFNIAAGRSPETGRVDLARLAEAIATIDADVLSLQEVDRDQRRSGGADLTAIAAAAMGAEHQVFAPALYGTPGSRWAAAGDRPQVGPAYGCALVSRRPLLDVHVLHLRAAPVALPLWVPGIGPVVAREEPRVAIFARVDCGAAATPTVIGTHLPFVPGWKGRQLKRLVREARSWPDPLLLLGDLNLRGDRPARLTGYCSLVRGPTYPSTRPRVQLDHVLLRGRLPELGTVVATSTARVVASDHRPVVVDVELARRPAG